MSQDSLLASDGIAERSQKETFSVRNFFFLQMSFLFSHFSLILSPFSFSPLRLNTNIIRGKDSTCYKNNVNGLLDYLSLWGSFKKCPAAITPKYITGVKRKEASKVKIWYRIGIKLQSDIKTKMLYSPLGGLHIKKQWNALQQFHLPPNPLIPLYFCFLFQTYIGP